MSNLISNRKKNIQSKKQKNSLKGKEAFWDDVSNHSPNNTKEIKPNGKSKAKEKISNLNTPCFIQIQEPSSHRNNRIGIDQELFQYPPSINTNIRDNFITFECRENIEKTLRTKEKMNSNVNYSEKKGCTSNGFEKHQNINNLRVDKFNQFLDKFDNNKHQQDNKPKSNRINHLYANAKMKNAYLEKLRNHGQTAKIKQETNECTFYPEINHRSRSIASADGRNVYERNMIWANNKIEKIQRIKKVKVYEREEYPYKPKITDYCRESNSKKTIKTNLSTVLYLERQQRARHNKHLSSDGFKTRYKSCSTEPSKRSVVNISQTFLSQCKALLHEELVQSREKDDEFGQQ